MRKVQYMPPHVNTSWSTALLTPSAGRSVHLSTRRSLTEGAPRCPQRARPSTTSMWYRPSELEPRKDSSEAVEPGVFALRFNCASNMVNVDLRLLEGLPDLPAVLAANVYRDLLHVIGQNHLRA